MLLCPKCQQEFDIYRFCPLDGKELIPIPGPDASPRPAEINRRFRLVRELNADGIARTYEAEDNVTHRTVWLKLYSPAFMASLHSVERFRTEAMRARTITHPALAPLHELDRAEDGCYFLVMDPAPGPSLRQWLASGPIPPAHAVAMMREVGGVLMGAHSQGLYHGYLTPNAIFVAAPEARPLNVRLYDAGTARFALAHRLQLVERGEADTVSAADLGYQAPELLGGEQESLLSEQSDIYSFGIILYEAIVGELPFQVEGGPAMIDAHMLLEPVAMSNLKPGPSIPAALDDLVLRCLAKQPKKRFASMAELLAALEPVHQFLETTLTSSPSPWGGLTKGPGTVAGPGSHASGSGLVGDPGSSEPLWVNAGRDAAGDRRSVLSADPTASDLANIYASTDPNVKPIPVGPTMDETQSVVAVSDPPEPQPTVLASAASVPISGPPAEAPPSMPGPGAVKASPPSGKKMKVITAIISLVVIAIVVFCITLAWVLYKPKYGKIEVKTTPGDAVVYLDGQRVGTSPMVNDRFPSGKHTVRLTKEGYQDWVKDFVLKPDSEQLFEPALQPLNSSKLSPDQQRKVQELIRKAELAAKENILIPPPDNYNALYFCDQILALDSTDVFANDMRKTILAKYRAMAAEAFDQGKWFEAERHYQSLATLFPDDASIKERLDEIAKKIEETKRDREKQVAELAGKIKQSLQTGALIPPEPDNALDNITSLQRINPKDAFARQSRAKLLELLRKRAENNIAASNFDGAKLDYIAIQRYFPAEKAAAARLDFINRKIADAGTPPEAKRPAVDPEQLRRSKYRELRQAGGESFKAGDYAATVQALEEARQLDGSDAELFYMLATAYKERRQFDLAISNYQHSLGLNPNQGNAHFNLGRLYESYLHDTSRAKQHYTKALQLGTAEMAADRLRKLIADMDYRERMSVLESAPIAVIHKHLTGSCRGNLYISGSLMRYDPDSGNDRFSEPLSNLVAEVKKDGTLSVQVKKGRRYNFQVVNAQDLGLLRQRLGREP